MTWHEAQVALQLEAEERVGELIRFYQERAHAEEDAAMRKVQETLGVNRG